MYKVITPPAVEPITVNDLKAQARYEIEVSPQDDILLNKVVAARQFIENHCAVAMIDQEIEIKYPCFNQFLPLEVTPNAGVGSLYVRYIDTDDVEQTLLASDYELLDYTSPNYVKIFLDSFPELHAKRSAPVRITYTAGFGASADDVPADLKEAVLIIATRFEAERINPDKALGLVGHLINHYKNYYGRL